MLSITVFLIIVFVNNFSIRVGSSDEDRLCPAFQAIVLGFGIKAKRGPNIGFETFKLQSMKSRHFRLRLLPTNWLLFQRRKSGEWFPNLVAHSANYSMSRAVRSLVLFFLASAKPKRGAGSTVCRLHKLVQKHRSELSGQFWAGKIPEFVRHCSRVENKLAS